MGESPGSAPAEVQLKMEELAAHLMETFPSLIARSGNAEGSAQAWARREPVRQTPDLGLAGAPGRRRYGLGCVGVSESSSRQASKRRGARASRLRRLGRPSDTGAKTFCDGWQSRIEAMSGIARSLGGTRPVSPHEKPPSICTKSDGKLIATVEESIV